MTLATELAVADCFSVLPPEAATPEHVAHLTSLTVVAAETALRDRLTAATPEQEPKHPDVTRAAHGAGLDDGQTMAAAAVASSDPLVIVEGAAGSGKTTMLRTAIDVAAEHGRAARVVAPTLRAAQVAHEELGVPATSVAALVHAHGWRWNRDGVWTRLHPGDTDPDTGRTYTGPARDAVLSRGERVIVDEAGMLDQDTAHALLTITQDAGATVALVGDRAQLPAVGRGGVLDMATQIRGRTYDMTELHRFADAEYASLTLTMRDRENPGDVFDQLSALGLVTLHADEEHARDHITDHASVGEAITVASNDGAAALNERIRAARVDRGEVDDTITSTGSDELPIGRGDLIQTRKNDTGLGVANRQQWIVQHVAEDGTVYAHEAPSGRKNLRTVALPPEYVAEHAHLSYVATAYGVQGATVNTSHTMLTEATNAAGIYVGMTRGREHNRLHVVAGDLADAKVQFIEAMERDPSDRGLDHATTQAVEAVRGIVKNGPIQRVTEELARLDQEAERAEQAAERWEQTANRLDAQHARHRAESDESTAVLRRAEEEAARVRVKVAAPLVEQAEQDGAAYLASVEAEGAANTRLARAGRLGRRKARHELRAAREQAATSRAHLRDAWDAEPPRTPGALPEWAAQVAGRKAEADPRVSDADQAVEAARTERATTGERHRNERLTLLARKYGAENARARQHGMRALNPHRNARDARTRAALLRAESEELRGMSVNEAAQTIETRRVERERALQQAEQRQRQLSSPEPLSRQGPGSQPERGIGL
ncbi:AAA family ATPase [Parenemella sanctibonifatiensis]|uniref:AAA family ATPase n=1 Tax=Parenemella sanctibonifatiensis TaxID=2016505 RepID=UPI001E605068|nr:AAA family ATPase [Parenemella sanctibonifatiensis]